MTRLIVLWTRPLRLPAQGIDAWLDDEVGRLHRLPAVRTLALTPLARASDRHARPADWLLEIELASNVRTEDCVDDPFFAEWFGDMRQMGMRPTIALADATRVLKRDDG